MKNQNFCHLHTHTSFSLLDGLIDVKELPKYAKEQGFEFVAATDHASVDGLLKLQQESEKNDILDIKGIEWYVIENPLEHNKDERRRHLTSWVKNDVGYTNLLKLLTKANLTGFYRKPRISYQDILENCEGLIIGSACIETFLWDKAGITFFENLLDIIPDDIYLEFMPHCTKEQINTNKLLLGLQKKYNVRSIATNDSHWLHKEDAKIQEILLAIQTGKKWSDPNRWKFDKGYKLHLKSADEMIAEFEKQGALPRDMIIRSMRNTIRIAEECCEFVIPKRNIALPCVPGLENVDEDKYLEQLVIRGYYEKIGEFFEPEHEKRIDEELAIIEKLGFSRYFLIVHDLITWARNHGIYVNSRGCFTGDTKVSLLDGTERSFEELEQDFRDKEFWVYSSSRSGKIVPGKAKNPRITKQVRRFCVVTLDNGEEIKCTFDHKFLMRDGTYKRALDLKENDSLMPLYRELDINGYEIYYDLSRSKFKYTHYLKDKYKAGMVIHHKDFNKSNNNPENLLQMEFGDHLELHSKITIKRNKDPEFRKKVSAGQKRIWSDPKYRKKMIEKMQNGVNSPEALAERKVRITLRNKSEKMREIVRKPKSKEHNQKVSEARKRFFKTEAGRVERENISKRTKGIKRTPEMRKRMSEAKKGTRISEETKTKLSKIFKGRIVSKETRRKISAALKGRVKSEEHRKKLSEAHKALGLTGEKNYMYGKKHPPEAIKKMSEAKKGKVLTEEHKRKISAGLILAFQEGRKLRRFGVKASDEARKNMSIAQTGRRHSEATKKKISESQKLRVKLDKELNNHKVKSIRIEHKVQDMYDIEVERYHNFALSSGVFVHNSVGCSFIANLIGISAVNPILYDLPFTRFINEDRVDMVDIDLDFQSDKRNDVINRLRELYGENNIANISTFGKMKGRSALRDVSRVFEIDEKEVDEAAKSIEENVSELIDNKHPFYDKHPEIVKYAQRLEGKERNAGKHASGIIVSDSDLRDGSRCSLAVRKSDIAVNWAKEDAEYCGLMKVDILGVATLAVIANTIKLIKENYNLEIDLNKIPMDDPKIYERLSSCESFVGVFQMGYAIQDIVRKAGVSNIVEWADAVALGRPGPAESGLVDQYINRKNGQEWEKKHPIYEEVTSKTYGLPVYQESVILIFNKVAGLPYSEADQIRRIIGRKRDKAEFEPYKKRFIEGCLKMQTLSEKEADHFWEDLQHYARYTFNYPHSMSYAITGYQCLYLKTYYPSEFLCSMLTYDQNASKVDIINEAVKIGLEIIPPKIGISDAQKWIAKDGKLYTPFVEIAGVGDKMSVEITKGGRFKRKKVKGFYVTDEKPSFTPSVQKILKEINAFDPNGKLPKGAFKYFEFAESMGDMYEIYPNLVQMLQQEYPRFGTSECTTGGISESTKLEILKSAKHGTFELSLFKEQNPFPINKKLLECRACSLCQEDIYDPVPCSPSRTNLMLCGEGPGCFTEDTIILSDEGSYCISDPILNTTLYQDNQVKADLKYRVKNYPIFEIKSNKMPAIKCSYDHKFLVSIRNHNGREKTKIPNGCSKPQWKTATEIHGLVGDNDVFMLVPRKTFSSSAKYQNIYFDKLKKYKTRRTDYELIDRIRLDSDLAFVMGAYMGDGFANFISGSVKIAISKGYKEKHLERILNTLKRIGIRTKVSYIDKVILIQLHSRTLCEFFLSSFGKDCYEKRVPKIIFQSPPHVIAQFLFGWYVTDGDHLKRNDKGFKICTVSKLAAWDAVILGLKTNVLMGVRNENPSGKNTKVVYKITLDSLVAKKLKWDVDLHPKPSVKYGSDRNFFYLKVNSIIPKLYSGIIYDKTTTLHQYNIPFTVHNSNESKEGEGFVGKAGDVLWSELEKYNLVRSDFHISNVAKCFPKKTRTPQKEHIHACAAWLDEEIEFVKPCIILALGGTAMYRFSGLEKGITQKSGTIEWNEKYSSYVVYCMHPASVFHSDSNRQKFEDGIKFYSECLKRLGGI